MRKRVEFFITCAGILLPLVFLCLYTKLNLIAFVDGEGPYYLWNKETANTSHEETYDVIILGDSIANAGYMPALLSDSCLNLSLGGTTPIENYYTLQDWLDHNPAPKVCYISFADFHFLRSDCFWSRSIYTHRYRFPQELEILMTAYQYQEPSILTKNYATDFVEYALCLPDKYMTALVNAQFNQRYKGNLASKQIDELYGGRYIKRTVTEAAEATAAIKKTASGKFGMNPVFDYYYRKLIELCVENNIIPRIVKSPISNDAPFSDSYIESFWNYYAALEEEYPQITVDWIPYYDIQYFADGSGHLNFHGALKFSLEIKRLYPEDFGDSDLTLRQAAAISDAIKGENKLEEIMKWINGKNYTVMIYDKSNSFSTFFEEKTTNELEMGDLVLSPASAAMAKEEGLYCVLGNGSINFDTTIVKNDKGLEVCQNGKAEKWSAANGKLNAIVIDGYRGDFVCNKTFNYTKGQYIVAK